MIVAGEIARIPGFHLQQTAFLRPPDHTNFGATGYELGKKGDDVDAHHRAAALLP